MCFKVTLQHKVTFQEKAVADREKDLDTLLEDVKIIKSILENQDASLPRLWVITWLAGTAIAVGCAAQFLVPFFRDMDFDGRFLWLWLPGFCVIFPFAMVFLTRELSRTGKALLGQARIRHLMYARFLIPPAALVVIWLLSRHPYLSLEGSIFVVASMWMTAVEQVFPPSFRALPFAVLGVGIVELAFSLTGPWITLANGLGVAAMLWYVGFLFRAQERRAGGA